MTHPFARDPHNPPVTRSAAELADVLGMELEPWQKDVLARFDRAPAAWESFRHLTTCEGTPDAPRLCECPPAVVPIGGTR